MIVFEYYGRIGGSYYSTAKNNEHYRNKEESVEMQDIKEKGLIMVSVCDTPFGVSQTDHGASGVI